MIKRNEENIYIRFNIFLRLLYRSALIKEKTKRQKNGGIKTEMAWCNLLIKRAVSCEIWGNNVTKKPRLQKETLKLKIRQELCNIDERFLIYTNHPKAITLFLPILSEAQPVINLPGMLIPPIRLRISAALVAEIPTSVAWGTRCVNTKFRQIPCINK